MKKFVFGFLISLLFFSCKSNFSNDDILGEWYYENGFDVKNDKMALQRLNIAFIPRYHLLQRQHSERETNVHMEKYIAAGRKIHEETIEVFCKHKDIQCLAALMRLEQDPCGKRYERRHIRNISSDLDELITCISKKMSLSHEEIVTLKVRIYRRLGLGVRYGVVLSY